MAGAGRCDAPAGRDCRGGGFPGISSPQAEELEGVNVGL